MAVEKAKWREKRDAKAKRRQEKRWKRKSGKVRVRFECPVCGGAHSRAEHDESPEGLLEAEIDRAASRD